MHTRFALKLEETMQNTYKTIVYDAYNGGYEEGSRIPVRTIIHTAFYMFILFSLVRTLLCNKQDNKAYPLNLDI